MLEKWHRHFVMPDLLSLLTRSHSEGRLGMALPFVRLGSIVNLTVVVCFFSYTSGVDSQIFFFKFVDIFLTLLLLPSLHNSVTSCAVFCFAFLFADALLLICLHLSTPTGHLTSLVLPCFLGRSVLTALSCCLIGSSALPHLVFSSVCCCSKLVSCAFSTPSYTLIILSNRLGHWQDICRDSAGRRRKKEMSSAPSSFLLTQIIEAMLMGDTTTQRRFNFVSKHLLESEKQTEWMCARREAFWKATCCKSGRFSVLLPVGFKERNSQCLFHYKKILCSLPKVRFVQ